MLKHTLGPWNTDTDDLGMWINSASEPTPIAKMGISKKHDQCANAKLIAAAPELLEALQALVASVEAVQPMVGFNLIRDYHAARAAIAKATNG